MPYDVVIIGGGYSGLSCGVLLTRAGQRVCVLERGRVLGGAFQPFRRGGMTLDTGFHYVGGVGEGEMMHPLMERLGLADLPWVRLDDDFLQVSCNGSSYSLTCGYDRFEESLIKNFPDEQEGIALLVETMRHVAEHIYETVDPQSGYVNELMQVSAKSWLEEHIKDSRLRRLLCAQAVTTNLTPDLPLYSFIQSLNSFVQHSYRIEGGGETIITRLRDVIVEGGGEVLTGRNVTTFQHDGNGRILSAVCSDGDEFAARQFISTLHPALSVALMPDCPQVRGIYRRRFSRMPNSRGIFTVQLILKPHTVPYLNHVLSILGSDDPWNADYGASAPVENLLVNYNVPCGDRAFAENIDLLTPMDFNAVAQWSESRVGARPDEYKRFKERRAQECINLAQRYIPELEGNIEAVYTSSPLTYRDYTGTVDGSAYGVCKSATSIAGGMLSPTTPFENLFLAGQSLMLHGMLGVGMTSLLVTNIMCAGVMVKG